MRDMNFFAAYKRGKSKNKSFAIFLTLLVVLLVLVNSLLFVYRMVKFAALENEIQSMQDYINNPATKQAMTDADRLKNEVELTTNYLMLLESANSKLDRMDVIGSELMQNIAQLTPENVFFESAQINGRSVSLSCAALEATDPMDMYHAFKESPLFNNVIMSGIAVSEGGCSFSFSFSLQEKEGEQP